MTAIDFHRALVFPNRIRKFRKQLNIGSLLELSERLSGITYIRLSKIERGEIFARAGELRELGRALGVDPVELLIDVDDPGFDIAVWAAPLHGPMPTDPEGEHGAVLLAAALRARRGGDPALTIAVLESEYGIAPVVLSRIENALKPFDRWNEDVRAALRRLFGAAGDAALTAQIEALHASGALDAVLPLVANPEIRLAKSRARIAALKDELAGAKAGVAVPAPASPAAPGPKPEPVASANLATLRLLPVLGTPLPGGLIAPTPTGAEVEAPRGAGPRAYGLRLGRPTLGAGLPGRATLVVDPDRYPATGGLAVVREGEALRVLSVTADRHGRMLGYSESPDLEVALDTLAPTDVAAVLSAVFE
ncbi:helix-turn-helix transcriptional regulator [Novosphingobium resinovorum]|uniref:helix-turn-helix domain-containing protein n=1 Tax=Novosphingobium resinovorum TaxID=158500 RepID=UPI002ED33B6C|nr:helix-turn-helix transcriptional regulator [Novosphingobium resinovorum]